MRGGSYVSPQWLTEGTATYGEHLYRTAQAKKHFLASGEDCQVWTSCLEQKHLDPNLVRQFNLLHGSLQGAFDNLDNDLTFNILNYDVAAAAIAWAVDRSGDPRSHLEYWRALARTHDWSTAFRTAFGMASDEFLDSFEQYHISLLEDTPRIRVTVVDDVDGTPIEGVGVLAQRHPGHVSVSGSTNPLGEIELPVPNGTYQVLLAWYNLFMLYYDKAGYAGLRIVSDMLEEVWAIWRL